MSEEEVELLLSPRSKRLVRAPRVDFYVFTNTNEQRDIYMDIHFGRVGENSEIVLTEIPRDIYIGENGKYRIFGIKRTSSKR